MGDSKKGWTVYSVEPAAIGLDYQVVATTWNPTPDESTRKLVTARPTKAEAEIEAAYLQRSYDSLRKVYASA